MLHTAAYAGTVPDAAALDTEDFAIKPSRRAEYSRTFIGHLCLVELGLDPNFASWDVTQL
jgi:hypothetical protein